MKKKKQAIIPVNEPRAARKAAGLTQEQVAQLSGISLSTIVRAERWGKWPTKGDTRRWHQFALRWQCE